MFGLYLFRLPSAYSRKLLAGLLSVTWSKFGSQGAPHSSRSTRIPLSETAHERTTKNPQSFELCGFRVHLWTALDAKLAEREGFEPSVDSHLRLISSQVHSTTLPPLRGRAFYQQLNKLGQFVRCHNVRILFGLVVSSLALAGCSEPPPTALPAWQQGLVVIVPEEHTGDEAGFEHELIELFAKNLQSQVKLVEVAPSQVIPLLHEGKAHFAVTSVSRASDSPLQLGPAYHATQLQVLCGTSLPQGIDELLNLPLAVVSGSMAESALLAAQQKQAALHWESRTDVTTSELLDEVVAGQLGCTVASTDLIEKLILLHPGLESAFDLGVPIPQVWAAPKDSDPELIAKMKEFFTRIQHDGTLKNLLDHHFGDPERGLEPHEAGDFIVSVATELPRYRKLFEEAGRVSGLDWRLIAAIAFHESKWDPLATSPTNVRGMMMLTEDTAERMGVHDRLNPRQSIRAGAKYLKLLKGRLPDSIEEPDRTWFALAAYNQGAAHLEDARILAQRRGLNPNYWVDVKSVFPLLAAPEHFETLKFGYARGGEAVFLVEQIRDYTKILRSLAPDTADEDIEPSILHSYFHPYEGMPRLLGIL